MNVALRSLELFAGAGGLALGLEAAGARAVCFVEREAYAASVLAARMEDETLPAAPVWSDVSTFDGRPWHGVVDLVAGGFPCQDISSAGKQVGITGARSGLWKQFERIVREVEPRFVFVENVGALVVRGLDVVLGDLASLGFDAEWGCFKASDVEAPHRRDRIFILAESNRGRRGQGPLSRQLRPAFAGEPSGNRGHAVATQGDQVAGVADANGRGRGLVGLVGLVGLRDHVRQERGNDSDRRRDRSPWPPGPDDRDGWREYLASRPGFEPSLCRGADGLAYRVDRLRALGNGVVPDCAALAWRVLWGRLMEAA